MIFDASSLINQHNGCLIELIRDSLNLTPCFGPQVMNECSSIQINIEQGIQNGRFKLLKDDNISAISFINLMEQYNLGGGETECLVLAKHYNLPVCCDDRLARSMINAEIGSGRITGTIGILIDLVRNGAISVSMAYNKYSDMKTAGAFLPIFNENWFDSNAS